jgi:SEL1 protein
LYHYQFVAEKVATAAKTLTHSPYVSQSRILDEDEIKDDQSAEVLLDEELLEYYSYLSNKGDVHSQVSLAQLLLQRGFDDDVSKAAELFQEVF